MRAWLLLLAVLATFQPTVQVASTEDITSRFIQAISSPSINQQQKQQQTNFEYVENSRDARNSFNTQQSTNVTAVSPVIDITALSVTKSYASIGARSSANARSNQKSTAASSATTTSIAAIFSSSDSDNSDNNSINNLNYKFSAKKDNSASRSENTSDALKAKANEIFELSEVKQKHKQSNKQIKYQNHNEVNEKSAKYTLVDPTKENSTENKQSNKVQQQQLENTESTSSQQESSAVNSEEEEEKEDEQEKALKNLSEMAFKENTIATAQEAHEEHSSSSSKRHRHHRQHHRHHQQQNEQHENHPHHQHQHHHHQHQLLKDSQQQTHQQHHQQHHKTTHAEAQKVTEQITSATEERLTAAERSATIERPAAEERLATKEHETTKDAERNAEEASATAHKAAAEKLARDSARSSVDGSSTANATLESSLPATAANSASITSTAFMSLSDTEVNASRDGDGVESDSESDSEPATYSNKEIIGEKLKPDPSTLVQIENSLLSLFNMKRPPKIDRSKIIIPEAMKQLYAQIMGHELDSVMIPRPGILTKSANTVRSFTHIESKIDDRFPHHHRFRLYFDVKSIPSEEKLKAAELQLSRDAISDAVFNKHLANRTRYQVLVYDITRVGVRGKREPSYLLLDNKAVRLNSTETVSLDVQPAVDRWLATPKKNYGLLIEVRTSRSLKPAPHHHVRLRRSADEPHESWQHKQPVLYTYTDDGKHKSRSIRDVSSRSKRAGHHRRAHRRKNSDEVCRRHSLYVDFADVGWSDWIVAPPGYDAFYCQGKCPFPLAEHMNSTNHAVVQTLVNNLNPGKVPKACCVPTQLEGISMLYLNDQNTVVLKNYQDMTVVGCGCR